MRRWLPVVALLGLQLLLFSRYAALDAQFHFWLHGLVGAATGLGVLTAVGLAGRAGGLSAWAAGLAGHVYSAFPDVLFLPGGVVHALWMDVFVFHVAWHFVPSPLPTAFACFAAALGGWAGVTLGRWRLGAGLLAVAVLVAGGALAARRPLPSTLAQVRDRGEATLLCPLPARPPRVPLNA